MMITNHGIIIWKKEKRGTAVGGLDFMYIPLRISVEREREKTENSENTVSAFLSETEAHLLIFIGR